MVDGPTLFASYSRGERMTIIDSHWAKSENSAWEAYVGQHIPGAMFCNPLLHLASIPSRQHGRNPLPEPDRFQRSTNDWGITHGKPVYIYDAGSNLYAARAWWTLRWAGVQDVHILNGGTGQWTKAGGDLAGGIGALRGRGNVTITPGSMPVLGIDEVDQWLADGKILVDARDMHRFSGRREPYDHQAGRIPGSINIPVEELESEPGRIAPVERIREVLASHGITDGREVAVYSGSGLHSSLFIAAMEQAGLRGAKNFVGGWSQWAASPQRPIERD